MIFLFFFFFTLITIIPSSFKIYETISDIYIYEKFKYFFSFQSHKSGPARIFEIAR